MKKRIRPKTFGPPQPSLPKLTPEEEHQLDYDICCCIEELENLLLNNPTERQKRLAEISIKVLKNPSEALIKKKQVMRQQFGDYRKKFESKKKEVLSNLNKNIVLINSNNKSSNSIFFKKHRKGTDSGFKNDVNTVCTDLGFSESGLNINDLKVVQNTSFYIETSDNSFKFNF